MVTDFHPAQPIPAAPLGQRLHEIFGRRLWDFIEAPAPAPGEKPQWRTITQYPLRPRILWQRWQDPGTLIGVRFESQTLYGLIDIDAGSPYCHPEAIAQLRAALETIGITRTLLLRSSHSHGLHLYLPLPEAVKTFDLAVALEACLTTQDFKIANGTLEIFPNPKPYGVDKIIHYNGHRLPLQPGTGSYLLDDDLNPISDKLDRFFWQWHGAASHQDMDELRHALKIGRDNRRKKPRRSLYPSNSTVEVWRQDLEAELEEGWSAYGQTNYLLKVIACYGHVFLGLAGDELITHSLETATQLPGYQQHCRHQHDIERRVKAWCKAVENYYWPLGDDPQRDPSRELSPQPSVNQQRAEEARDRIIKAVESLKQIGNWPSTVRALAQCIAQTAHCGFKTLYKHLTLWHPEHVPAPAEEYVTAQPESPSALCELENQPHLTQPSVESGCSEPLPNGVLHTEERGMKCTCHNEPLLLKKSPERGVRGENCRFPQPSGVSVPPPIPFSEAHPAIQAKVHALGWELEQVRAFLREHFQGRDRIWLLSENELTTYLYHLEIEMMSLGKREKS